MCRVAIICNYLLLPERIGGMDHFFKLFNQELTAQNVAVDWYLSGAKSHAFYDEFNLHLAGKTTVENVFLNLSKDRSYDVIMTHFTELCTSFFKNIRTLHPKSQIVAVDHNPRPLEGYDFKTRIKKKLKGILYSKYINTFVAVSPYSERYLKKDFGSHITKKIQVIYNGIDTDKYEKKTNASKGNRFIVASHLREQKGIQYLMNALGKINKALNDNFHVDVYGEGPYENQLKEQVKVNSLEEKITFKGSVDNLYSIYKNYDYLIHPSLGETYCYSVVESLLTGLPVITTKDSGNVLGLIKEGENGFLFQEKDDVRLSEIIANVHSNNMSIDQQMMKNVSMPDLSLNTMVKNYVKLVACM